MTREQAQAIYKEWASQEPEKQQGFIELLARLEILKFDGETDGKEASEATQAQAGMLALVSAKNQHV